MAELRRWVRRHRTVAAIAAAWLTMVVSFPTLQLPERPAFGFASGAGAGAGNASGDPFTDGDVAAAVEGAVAGEAEGGVAGQVAAGKASAGPRGRAAGAGGPAAAATESVAAAGGRACRALPAPPPSVYFPSCVPEWTGDNGGATAPGVSRTKIRIADFWSNDPAAALAPGTDPAIYATARDTFIAHFNRMFQLYGRQVEIVDFYAENDDEHAGACIDAARLQSMDVFAVFSAPPNFAKCAAEERGILSFAAAEEHPESFYAKHHPYIWGYTMDCERTGHQLAEYLGKRVAHRPARWAGDASMRTKPRRLGLYVPEDDIYGPCIQHAERGLKEKYGAEFVSVFRYGPSLERLADQANRAVLQFKDDDVTSVVLAADTISIELMTHGATAQDWHPEWVTTGVAGQTFDYIGRGYDQSQVDGHMFGRAVFAEERKWYGPEGEPNQVHRQLTGKDIGARTQGGFYGFHEIFDRIQAAGPRLDAHAIAQGSFSSPEAGSATAPFGPFSNRARPDGSPGIDHSRQDAAREVYWDGSARSWDGQSGAFISTMGGRYVRQGEWTREEPPVYPGR